MFKFRLLLLLGAVFSFVIQSLFSSNIFFDIFLEFVNVWFSNINLFELLFVLFCSCFIVEILFVWGLDGITWFSSNCFLVFWELLFSFVNLCSLYSSGTGSSSVNKISYGDAYLTFSFDYERLNPKTQKIINYIDKLVKKFFF